MNAEPLLDVTKFVSILHRPDDVFEVRIPQYDDRKSTASGYFDNTADAAAAVARWDGRANIYVTLNPVNPALLARRANRIDQRVRETTTDAQVVARRWLLVDIDPDRPTGISSTDAECLASLEVARRVVTFMSEAGCGKPVTFMSGNGHGLLYPVDLPNDAASETLVKGVLASLATRFDDDDVKVDQSVSNAARIGALVGTMKVKGDSTADRPHRRSSLLYAPSTLDPVPVERLAALVPVVAASHSSITITSGSLEPGWVKLRLDAAGVDYREHPRGGTTWFDVADCPAHPGEGEPYTCGVGEEAGGRAVGHGFHNRCKPWGWADFRDALGLGTGSGSTPKTSVSSPVDRTPKGKRHLRLTKASTITIRAVRWLWADRLPLGALSLLAGREGIGKTTVAYTLAADVTTGRLPGAFFGKPKGVIVAATEDAWEETIVPRLMAARADLDLVFRVDVIASEGFDSQLSLPADIGALEGLIEEAGASLLLLDPLMSRLSPSLDTHKDAEVRQALEPVVAIAQRAQVTCLGIIHVNKSGSTDPLTMIMGSRAFAAVSRAVLFLMLDPDDKAIRLLGQPKNNLGRSDLPTLTLRIESAHVADTADGPVTTGKVVWVGESELDIRDALTPAAKAAPDDAMSKFMVATLVANNGVMPASAVWEALETEGFSVTDKKIVYAARDRAGIRIRKVGMDGGWEWFLAPKSAKSGETYSSHSSSLFGVSDSSKSEKSEKSDEECGLPAREPNPPVVNLVAAALDLFDDMRVDPPPGPSRIHRMIFGENTLIPDPGRGDS